MTEIFLTYPAPNRHSADELGDVREQLAALKQREHELRLEIIESGDVDGDEYRAEIREGKQERLNTRAVRQHFGDKVLKPFLVTAAYIKVRVEKKKK